MGRFKAGDMHGGRCPLCDTYFSVHDHPSMLDNILPGHSVKGEVYPYETVEASEDEDEEEDGRTLEHDECPFSDVSWLLTPTEEEQDDFDAVLMQVRLVERLLASESFLDRLARALAERGAK
jgi:hypothetical protein